MSFKILWISKNILVVKYIKEGCIQQLKCTYLSDRVEQSKCKEVATPLKIILFRIGVGTESWWGAIIILHVYLCQCYL